MSDLSERLRYCADSPCVGEPELRDLLREAAAALAKREPQIECPACGAVVKQVASATLGLELWQHWNWVCSYRQQAEARVSALQRELETARVDSWCDACCGTGKPASGEPCMCSGTGLASMAVTYLRERLVKIERERDAAQAWAREQSMEEREQRARAEKAERELEEARAACRRD